jgi:hypothetical protein
MAVVLACQIASSLRARVGGVISGCDGFQREKSGHRITFSTS